MIKSLEEKIGEIRNYSSCPIDAFSNKINLIKVITDDGKNLRFIEKLFNDEFEYPEKKKIESYVSKILHEQGVSVPKIICEDETRIIYEFIESKTIDLRVLQDNILGILINIHDKNFNSKKLIDNVPFRNSDLRIYQVNNWLNVLSKSGLNIEFSKNKIMAAFKIRDSKYESYTLSLRDCGTHNAIYNGNKTFLIDFERACFGHPSDDLASLIVENILPEKIILERYLSVIGYSHKCNDKEFNLELSSSLFEKSLEILTYFKTGKGNISESKRESILNKYINLVNKYYERLCQNLDNGN